MVKLRRQSEPKMYHCSKWDTCGGKTFKQFFKHRYNVHPKSKGIKKILCTSPAYCAICADFKSKLSKKIMKRPWIGHDSKHRPWIGHFTNNHIDLLFDMI